MENICTLYNYTIAYICDKGRCVLYVEADSLDSVVVFDEGR